MPKETFFHLTDEKKGRIMSAAKKEFSRVPLNEASIARIIKDAEIPRGSFYQYFEDKEDLYFYYFQSMRRNSQQELQQAMQEADGDLFRGIEIYFYKLVKEVLHGDNAAFYKNLFMNMDYRSFHKVAPHMNKNGHHRGHPHGPLSPKDVQAFYEMIDLSRLKVADQEELALLVKMLMHLVFSTIAEDYRRLMGTTEEDNGKAIRDFDLKLSWLKNGALKEPTEKSNEQGRYEP